MDGEKREAEEGPVEQERRLSRSREEEETEQRQLHRACMPVGVSFDWA